ILQRFLATHALVGLDDVLERYPFERSWAQQQLEDWTHKGRLVRIITAEAEPLQWTDPRNFEQMQRSTLSILRREVMTCPAGQFADFVLRWQHVHPAAQADGLAEILDRLQGCTLPANLWEQAILPLRYPNYQPRQLDELSGAGDWTWYCRQDSDDATPMLDFVKRTALTSLTPPVSEGMELDLAASAVMAVLRSRGALFAAEMATQAQLAVGAVRSALWSLLRFGLVTNDRFDVVRRGEPPRNDEPPNMRSRGEVRAFLRDSRRRQETVYPEGRWTLLAWGPPDPESAAYFQARLLLERYGIVSRELSLMDSAMPPWRVLYEILSRMELAGEVRRGYFVEGLSGAQFALPEASKILHEIAMPSSAEAPVILMHSLDPANLYGSGAALELPASSQEPRSFLRRAANWLVVKAGRPLLLVEQQGKRLTTLPPANTDDLAAAVARLSDLLKLTPSRDIRHK